MLRNAAWVYWVSGTNAQIRQLRQRLQRVQEDELPVVEATSANNLAVGWIWKVMIHEAPAPTLHVRFGPLERKTNIYI